MKIIVSEEIEQVCPGFVGAAVEADVVNSQYSPELWAEIKVLGEKYRVEYDTTTIKSIPGIEATRRVYRLCGKDPSRYRPVNQPCEHRLRLQHRRFRCRQVFRRHAYTRHRT